jgi:hypothetical protein
MKEFSGKSKENNQSIGYQENRNGDKSPSHPQATLFIYTMSTWEVLNDQVLV